METNNLDTEVLSPQQQIERLFSLPDGNYFDEDIINATRDAIMAVCRIQQATFVGSDGNVYTCMYQEKDQIMALYRVEQRPYEGMYPVVIDCTLLTFEGTTTGRVIKEDKKGDYPLLTALRISLEDPKYASWHLYRIMHDLVDNVGIHNVEEILQEAELFFEELCIPWGQYALNYKSFPKGYYDHSDNTYAMWASIISAAIQAYEPDHHKHHDFADAVGVDIIAAAKLLQFATPGDPRRQKFIQILGLDPKEFIDRFYSLHR